MLASGMRIPPSAIVLPLILAVPFGFAIRDSLRGTDRAGEEAKAKQALVELEAKEHEETLAAEREQYERTTQLAKERAVVFGSLLGREPGSLGSAVGDHQLAELASLPLDPAVDRVILDRAERTANDGKLVSVAFTISDKPELCSELRAAMAARWGHSQSWDRDDMVWVDGAHHQRAGIRTVDAMCVVDFTRIVDDTAWVEAALPKVLGKTRSQAEQLLGPPPNPELSAWYSPGPPAGHDATTLSVAVEGGRVMGTVATASVSDDEAAAIINAVTNKLGNQPRHVTAGPWTWNNGSVTLTFSPPLLELSHEK
jgi:hypothetical protein